MLVLYFSSHHLGHLSSLDEFSGQYDPSFSLLPVDTELKYNPNLVTGVPFLPDTPVGFLLMSTFLPRIDIGSLF